MELLHEIEGSYVQRGLFQQGMPLKGDGIKEALIDPFNEF